MPVRLNALPVGRRPLFDAFAAPNQPNLQVSIHNVTYRAWSARRSNIVTLAAPRRSLGELLPETLLFDGRDRRPELRAAAAVG